MPAARRYDSMEAEKRYISWEEYFPVRRREVVRRVDSAEAIRCSDSTLRRAVGILDSVCVEASRRGFKTRMVYRGGHLGVGRGGTDVHMRFIELGHRERATDVDCENACVMGFLASVFSYS